MILPAPNDPTDITIAPIWEQIPIARLDGVIMIIGAPSTGKSTLARHLHDRLQQNHARVALIDGDMGQASLGPPTTMTLAMGNQGEAAFPPAGSRHHAFVGDVAPHRHMLPTLVGAHKLVQQARAAGATAIVFDTTGLIDPQQGGSELKWAKVSLLRPTTLVALQRGNELESLLAPLRHSPTLQIIDLPVSDAAQPRDSAARREHRIERFRHYFASSSTLEVPWQRLAVFPTATFTLHRLVALEDSAGFARALGIVTGSDPEHSVVALHTPLESLNEVHAVRLGDLLLNPHTCRETRLD